MVEKNELIGEKITVEGRSGVVVDVSAGKYRIDWDNGDEWSWVKKEDLKVGEEQEVKDTEEDKYLGKEVVLKGRRGEIVDVSAGKYRVNFEDGLEWIPEGDLTGEKE